MMKRFAVLLVGVAMGCGGSSGSGKAPTLAARQAPAPAKASPPPAPPAPEVATTPADKGEVSVTGDKTAAPEVPAAPAAPRAEAEVKLLKGAATAGHLTFEQQGNKVTISGSFTGLPPGEHGFQIHENGMCDGKNANTAGKDFNPGKTKHGAVGSPIRHLGDFGNLVVDMDGNASFEMTTDSLTVAQGVDSVVGRSILITAKKDDGKTQPSGNAGPAIACGVIASGDAGVATAK